MRPGLTAWSPLPGLCSTQRGLIRREAGEAAIVGAVCMCVCARLNTPVWEQCAYVSAELNVHEYLWPEPGLLRK